MKEIREFMALLVNMVSPRSTIYIPVEFDDGSVEMVTIRRSQIRGAQASGDQQARFREAVERSLRDDQLNREFAAFAALSADEQRRTIKGDEA